MQNLKGELNIAGQCISYTLKRSKKRRRTLTAIMHPHEGLVVSVPWKTSENELKTFLQTNQRWILSQIQHLDTIPRYQYITGEKFSYLGESCSLQVNESDELPRNCVYQAGELQVTIPAHGDKMLQSKAVYMQLKSWYQQQAQLMLVDRLDFWKTKLQVNYNKLMISNAKQQWGCCDIKNNIRINWRIMLTSLELMDYLLVHELCHVRHKNHSAAFWKLVGSVMPDYVKRRKLLRKDPAGYLGIITH